MSIFYFRSLNENPGVWDKITNNTIRVVSLNISRLKPHMEDLKNDSTILKADIIHLGETWVTTDPLFEQYGFTMDQVKSDLFQLEGFTADFVSVGKGRGIVTYSRGNFLHEEDKKEKDYQMTKFRAPNADSIHVYRSAEGSQQSVVENLNQLIEPERLTVITGDFNICLDKKPDNQITSFLCGRGFKQLVTSPTHKAGGRIDHAYIWDPNTELSDSSMTQYCPYYSDHDALCLTLTTKVGFTILFTS